MRDFFIASHDGWDDPEIWERNGRNDVDLALTQLKADWLAKAEVLEIGCGVGRLVPAMKPRVASYTGIDISRSIVEEARTRCQKFRDVRFFESDGCSIPAEASDRRYDFVLVFAVFIHCPLDIITENLKSVRSVLTDDAIVRFSLRADHDDHEGIVGPPEQIESTVADVARISEEFAETEEASLVDDRNYAGYAFGYQESREVLEAIFPEARVGLYRPDPFTTYAEVRLNPASA